MVTMYHILTGMIGSIAVPIISQTSSLDAGYLWSIIFAWLFPTYNISQIATVVSFKVISSGIKNENFQTFQNENVRIACKKLDCTIPMFKAVTACCGTASERLYVDNVLFVGNRKGILVYVIFLAVQGFIYWIWVFMRENDQFTKLFALIRCRKADNPIWDITDTDKVDERDVEDSDVIAEKSVVQRLANNNKTALVSNNLVKW